MNQVSVYLKKSPYKYEKRDVGTHGVAGAAAVGVSAPPDNGHRSEGMY